MFRRSWLATFSTLAVLAVVCGAAARGFAATSVTQFGITWKFDRDYPTGQFANGDFWVVGPITITDISPRPSSSADGTVMHGTMINPRPNAGHGFDSRVRNNKFDGSLNAGRNLPLKVPAGSSIVSAESYLPLSNGNDPQLKTIAVLTVLSEAPPSGSFRPPYTGTDKRIRWNVRDLDYSRLQTLPAVAPAPALSTVESYFEKPFIDLRSSYASTYLQPKTNHPAYGRELSHQTAAALLSLQLNYTPAQKERLLIRVVQRGIDIYGLMQNGANWANDGGHRHGRKPTLITAASILKSAEMLAACDATKQFIFQEDQQTFYVSMDDVQRTRKSSDGRAREPYTKAMIGTAEWGGRHVGEPEGDASQWTAKYRDVCGASTVGTVLAARLMGLESAWNWPALFEYIDRYYAAERKNVSSSTNSIQPFVAAMWEAYRQQPPPRGGSSVSPAPAPQPISVQGRLINLSTRGRAGSGESTLIASFVVGGTQPQEVLIRAIGPSLAPFGVASLLSDPQLTLYQGQSSVSTNDNWGGSAAVAAAAKQSGAFALSSGSRDAALVRTLAPGIYSTHVTTSGSTSGEALVELYACNGETGGLVNLATRGQVSGDQEPLIAGLAIAGGSRKVLIRAVGPGLSQFNLSRPLANPVLTVMQGTTTVATNDNWSSEPHAASAANQAGAFPLPAGSLDAVLVLTLPAGNYTALVTGASGAEGTALVEVYELP